jgi:hypothetical protein
MSYLNMEQLKRGKIPDNMTNIPSDPSIYASNKLAANKNS